METYIVNVIGRIIIIDDDKTFNSSIILKNELNYHITHDELLELKPWIRNIESIKEKCIIIKCYADAVGNDKILIKDMQNIYNLLTSRCNIIYYEK